MIRAGDKYHAPIRGNRDICVDGEKVAEITTHFAFKLQVDKYGLINDEWVANDRSKLLSFAQDMQISDYTGRRLTF